jgi:hypothetical protein
VDWEYDCGYEGGVSREDSKTEYQPGTSSDEPETGTESSNDELEWDLQQQHELLAEVATLTRPTPYPQISNLKTMHDWAKPEHWVIMASHSAVSDKNRKLFVIRRGFKSRHKYHELSQFWTTEHYN